MTLPCYFLEPTTHRFLHRGDGMENLEDFWSKVPCFSCTGPHSQTLGNPTAFRTLHRVPLEGCPGFGMSSCEGRMASKPCIQNVNAPISLSVSGLAYPGLALPQHRHSSVKFVLGTAPQFLPSQWVQWLGAHRPSEPGKGLDQYRLLISMPRPAQTPLQLPRSQDTPIG